MFRKSCWPRTTSCSVRLPWVRGIVAGLLTGTLSVFVWKNIPALSDKMYELIPAFFTSLLFTVAFSLVFPDREAGRTDP